MSTAESTTATHTPGQWVWWTSNSWNRLRASKAGVDTNVLYPFVCNDGQPTIIASEPDMCLIAAAPDLLAAAKHILAIFEHPKRSVTVLDAEKLGAAIAKAEGRS